MLDLAETPRLVVSRSLAMETFCHLSGTNGAAWIASGWGVRCGAFRGRFLRKHANEQGKGGEKNKKTSQVTTRHPPFQRKYRRTEMSCTEAVSQWEQTVSRHLPHVSRRQVEVVAL